MPCIPNSTSNGCLVAWPKYHMNRHCEVNQYRLLKFSMKHNSAWYHMIPIRHILPAFDSTWYINKYWDELCKIDSYLRFCNVRVEKKCSFNILLLLGSQVETFNFSIRDLAFRLSDLHVSLANSVINNSTKMPIKELWNGTSNRFFI